MNTAGVAGGGSSDRGDAGRAAMEQRQRWPSEFGHGIGHARCPFWAQQLLDVTVSLCECKTKPINAVLTAITTRAINTTVDAIRNNAVFADGSVSVMP